MDQASQTEEYDVVIIGSGIAGTSAALAAHAEGLSAVILEKGAKAGGGTTYSYGGLWLGCTHLQREAGLEDDLDDVIAYMRHLGGGYEVPAQQQVYIEQGPVALEYFHRLGVPFQLVRGLPDHYHGHAPGSRAEGRMVETALISTDDLGDWKDKVDVSPELPMGVTFEEAIAWGGIGNARNYDAETMAQRRAANLRGFGAGLAANFIKLLLDRQVPILLETPATRLIREGGRVVGVEADRGGVPTVFRARRGVVLAGGGYEANPELINRFEDVTGWVSMFPDTLTGDPLMMATELGAGVHVIRRHMALFLGFPMPATKENPRAFLRLAGIQELSKPHTLVVNRAGHRFADESYFQSILDALRDFDVWEHRYTNQPCYLVFDSQYTAKYSFGGFEVGYVPDWVQRADTLDELAAKIGVDAENLVHSVQRLNKFAEAGVDEDYQRGEAPWAQYYTGDLTSSNPNLGPVGEGPFYGVELKPSGLSSAGLMTDPHARVLTSRGVPIEGLYASGNNAAFVDYGSGYQAGYSLARSIIFSKQAIDHIVEGRGDGA
ncbi:FAD-dependent oxidoreductase [Mycolicibacterium palauense]|uniref:FAD-dependent oxidoreductase n=1 Tax=Mycolicibacterium palauense TaxID=2034511 RepID=UPI00159BDAA3|nr:FAD-dependent oxidoreductase [Mycolicibacterium palauense]